MDTTLDDAKDDDHAVVYVDLIEDQPVTRAEFDERNALTEDEGDEAYAHYLNDFQPFRWHAENAGNHEILSHGERYFNEADALANIGQQFGISTMVYLRRAEHGDQLIRSAYPNHLGDIIEIGPACFAQADGTVLNWRGQNYVPQDPAMAAAATSLAVLGATARVLGLGEEVLADDTDEATRKAVAADAVAFLKQLAGIE
ncbi:hypothetical protein EV580_1356 [Mycobacterium sp. BK086]|uniref:hypothetical protein n=1 Tax=Mycobacterium sp. BK086 TaxID=2512165 RepID=UPI001060EB17|nr:hypothetical protein [Mycobacterium sp. BK086]TDO18172.1 hypothetical protein EV580_1356 [Mycobacterium sp. BK086]